MADIIPAISLGAFRATSTGLQLPKSKVPYERWEAFGRQLRVVQGSLRWAIGDWLNYGERTYGELYSQAVNIFPDYSQSSLEKCSYVSARIPYDSRRDGIGWTLHAEVAKLPPAEREQWLDELELGMTRAELRLSLDGSEPKEKHECPLCGKEHVVD